MSLCSVFVVVLCHFIIIFQMESVFVVVFVVVMSLFVVVLCLFIIILCLFVIILCLFVVVLHP